MPVTTSPGTIRHLVQALECRQISRRTFIECAIYAGAGTGLAISLANAGPAAAQEATGGDKPPAGSARGLPKNDPAATNSPGSSQRPDSGTENQERGAGGVLTLAQGRAPGVLSPINATSSVDYLGATPVMEPLMNFLPDGTLIPTLVTEVPSIANGLLGGDLLSVTYTLLEGVTWSDGEPFTADDVRFTWELSKDPDRVYQSYANNAWVMQKIEDIEVVDDLTATVHFFEPNPLWFQAFAGTMTGFVYPRHLFSGNAQDIVSFGNQPIGTGPFTVDRFVAGERVEYSANAMYREPAKPYFASIVLQGADPQQVTDAVIRQGTADFAPDITIDPASFRDLANGEHTGTVMVYPTAYVEKINFNFSDPYTEVDGQVSEMNTPNPITTDPAVREAIAVAIDREAIATAAFLGKDGEPAVANLIVGIPALDSPHNELVFDPDKARALLDAAGWALNGDVREKDGTRLSLSLATLDDPTRQSIARMIGDYLQAVGVRLEIQLLDGASLFAPETAQGLANMQSYMRFPYDMAMYRNGPLSPEPFNYLQEWYAGPDRDNIAQKANDWSGSNTLRYINPDFDALYEQARAETDATALAGDFIALNDMLIADHASIPLVATGTVSAVSDTLNAENLALGPFEMEYWNIANWNRVAE